MHSPAQSPATLPARSSRLSGFYQKSVAERVALVADWARLSADEIALLNDGLSVAQADKMIENVIGRFMLPLGVAANFRINGRDYLVPMVVEEPSVVAAVSYAAKLARQGGGFRTGSTDPVMIAQVQLLDVADPNRAAAAIAAERETLLALANTSPSIAARGGGPVDVEVHQLDETPTGPMMIVHLLFDARDAMGANAINTAAETIAPVLEQLSGGRALLRILSNLSDRRRAWAEVSIPVHELGTMEVSGDEVARDIAHANAFAVADAHRAATHNKGILNGVDAVALATGNDWRAIEAGAHAWAARDGHYRALTEWRVEQASKGAEEQGSRGTGKQGSRGALLSTPDSSGLPSSLSIDNSPLTIDHSSSPRLSGRLKMPLAVGTVGGATRAHPTAGVAMKILGVSGARELSEVMVAVGLAQNLAALRALATEGIQRGHMSLHARQIAVAAGAEGSDVERVAAQLIDEGAIRVERARELLQTDD